MRGTKTKRLAVVLALLLAAGVAVSRLAPLVERQFAIDSCLDAGGAFDDRQNRCRYENWPKIGS